MQIYDIDDSEDDKNDEEKYSVRSVHFSPLIFIVSIGHLDMV